MKPFQFYKSRHALVQLFGVGLWLAFLYSSCEAPVSPDLVKKTVPQLIQDLKSSESRVRAQAAIAIGQRPSSEAKVAVPELIKLFRDQVPVVRKRAQEALIAIGKDAVPDLIKALDAIDPTVRFHAGRALEKIPTPQAQKAFLKYLDEEKKQV
ncbi:MAG: HEAT repeat domain-containing protein [Candidatus Omnitrophica bacterium]|nr:HEAT repeat domain-containing protein [Candidatus Omnitrophota bacterium]